MVRILYLMFVFSKWYKWFSDGQESTEDGQHPDQPVSISTPQIVTKINEIVHGDCRMRIRMIAKTTFCDNIF